MAAKGVFGKRGTSGRRYSVQARKRILADIQRGVESEGLTQGGAVERYGKGVSQPTLTRWGMPREYVRGRLPDGMKRIAKVGTRKQTIVIGPETLRKLLKLAR